MGLSQDDYPQGFLGSKLWVEWNSSTLTLSYVLFICVWGHWLNKVSGGFNLSGAGVFTISTRLNFPQKVLSRAKMPVKEKW